MVPQEVLDDAVALGFGTEEMELASGETVWLLVPRGEAKVGLPIYLHYVDGILEASSHDESIALLSDPAFEGGE